MSNHLDLHHPHSPDYVPKAVECPNCTDPFMPENYCVERGRKEFCSDDCADEYFAEDE